MGMQYRISSRSKRWFRFIVLILLDSGLSAGIFALETGAPPDGDLNRDGEVNAAAAAAFSGVTITVAAGRWDPDASGGAGGGATDLVTSPAIDRGNPAADFSREQWPNGGRLDLGVYGNTREANRTPAEKER